MRRPTKLPPLFGAVVRPLQAFFRLEAASGILLFLAAAGAMAWANSSFAGSYRAALEWPFTVGAGARVAKFTLVELINDGLMTLFFFVVGMEIKRELVRGELRTPARAMLPAIAALGGMIVPSAIFLAFNHAGPGRPGWGIPMATDIAFSIGCLTLLKRQVPYALVVFLTALAIFDDIGGILVIAFFYGHGLHWEWLLSAATLALALFAMNRAHVCSGLGYGAAGAALWYALHHGGIHATISGVILAMAIPASSRRSPREVIEDLARHLMAPREPIEEEADASAAELLMIEEEIEDVEAPLDRFVHLLHPYVAFGIMPLFALANSGVAVGVLGWADLTGRVALGTALGLLFGKMLGIFVFTLAAVKLRWAPMPGQASLAKLLGVSIVAGIGFTVALFIAALAFPGSQALLDQAKIGILLGSLAAGVIGSAILRFTGPASTAR
jgi:NhaA family Na+:H+ antiporter